MNKQIVFQDGILNSLRKVLNSTNPKSIFLVTGKKSFSDSGAKSAIDTLIKNYHYVHFFDFEENPKIEDVERGLYEYHNNSCDLIIAIGGGSVMDMSKLISGLAYQDKGLIELIKLNQTNPNPASIIAIPTTGGTGSEATEFAVVYINGEKYSYTNQDILPSYVILDASLSYSTPKYLTAITGCDALCQAFESMWSLNGNEESKNYSELAIELLWNNIEKAVTNNDFEAKNKMMLGAFWAGKAINISKTTACHALSYKITSLYSIPHGHAVALTLTEVMKLNYNYAKDEIDKILKLIDATDLNEGVEKIKGVLDRIGLEQKLSKLNIPFEGIQKLKNCNLQRMKNNPVLLDEKEVERIFTAIF